MVDLAIAIIERDIKKGDTTAIKLQALQLGYLCSLKLQDVQKQTDFTYRILQLSIKYLLNEVGIRKIEKLILT